MTDLGGFDGDPFLAASWHDLGMDQSLDHYLLRRLVEVASNGGYFLGLLNEAMDSGQDRTEFSFNIIDVVVDWENARVEIADVIEADSAVDIPLGAFLLFVENVAAVTPRLRKRITEEYGASTERVLWALGCLPATGQSRGERLPAAVVLWAGGQYHRLIDCVREAHCDWRDVLVRGGLEHGDWREQLDSELGITPDPEQ
jgi:hypothetical protein